MAAGQVNNGECVNGAYTHCTTAMQLLIRMDSDSPNSACLHLIRVIQAYTRPTSGQYEVFYCVEGLRQTYCKEPDVTTRSVYYVDLSMLYLSPPVVPVVNTRVNIQCATL